MRNNSNETSNNPKYNINHLLYANDNLDNVRVTILIRNGTLITVEKFSLDSKNKWNEHVTENSIRFGTGPNDRLKL